MKNYKIKSSAVILGLALMMSACGSSDSNNDGEGGGEVPDIESAKKLLTFYGTASNDNYAFDIETQTLTNLNENNKTAILDGEEGRLFVWVDNKGDDNASTNEDKVIMFHKNYSFTEDGNATWEDFYYLNHLHDGEMHPHANTEFNTTDSESGKFKAMIRINEYLQEQETLKTELSTLISAKGATLCDYNSVVHEDETHYYVLGTNGILYTYENDGTTTFKDATLVSSAGCTVGESGMSAADEGVIIYLKNTSTLYLVDSHEDGVSHVHSEFDLSEIIGDGKSIDMMVGIVDLEHDDENHDH